MRFIKAEFRKMTSTNLWWLMLLAVVALTAVALAINAFIAHEAFAEPQLSMGGMSSYDAEQMRASMEASIDRVAIAANLYTSGQYFGLMFTLVAGILLVTNEYFHQTATTTFLVTPRRTQVIFAKLATAMGWGVGLWLITTLLSLPVGMLLLSSEGADIYLGEWGVIRAILLNLVAYCIWAIFGVGFGALLRNQIAALVVSLVLYLIGPSVARVFFALLVRITELEWLNKLQVLVPSIASDLVTSGVNEPGIAPHWVGVLVLIGYAVVAGCIGMFVTQRRDIV